MNLSSTIESWLAAFQGSGEPKTLLARIILAIVVLLISILSFYISRRIVRETFHRIFERTRFTWDDRLKENKLLLRITLAVPALIVHFFLPALLGGYDTALAVAEGIVNIYFILVAVLVLDALINAAHDIYQSFQVSREIPLKGFSQVLKIVLYGTGLILVISVLLDRSPIYLLSGLGALTAVLMLIFKDPILGFVAGIQLISNRMLKNGDWIEMPKYGASGDVIEITLTTVKVSNWDNTITTIPTYALINDSFKNWRGMTESAGRRIKRALYVDMNTIRFCTPEMLVRFEGIELIADYMRHKKEAVAQHNSQLEDRVPQTVNTRRLTNIGTFRAYALAFLKNHPQIHTEMTLMVRQLAPCAHGLPLEIYAFSRDKRWVFYENLQADIFDHLLAIAPEFDLKAYQYPAGRDLARSASISPPDL